jgi:hypothetical protein
MTARVPLGKAPVCAIIVGLCKLNWVRCAFQTGALFHFS